MRLHARDAALRTAGRIKKFSGNSSRNNRPALQQRRSAPFCDAGSVSDVSTVCEHGLDAADILLSFHTTQAREAPSKSAGLVKRVRGLGGARRQI